MVTPRPVVGATAPPTPTLLERLTRLGVAVLGTLPDAALTRLAGMPTEIDGQRLEPEVQAALRILNALPEESFDDLSLSKGRRQIDVEAWQFGGRPLPAGSVRDLEIPGADVPIPAWLYLPEGADSDTAVAVYFHGGGFCPRVHRVPRPGGAVSHPPRQGRGPVGRLPPRAGAPLHADDLSGLPPTLFGYAGFDPVRDESRAYAARLREAGVEVDEVFLPGHVDPFSNVLGAGRTGKAATQEIARKLGELMARR